MKLIVFDPAEVREHLLPITFTRPVGDIRMGIDTMSARWLAYVPASTCCYETEDYLSEVFPTAESVEPDDLFVAGNVIATAPLAAAAVALAPGQALVGVDGRLIARRGPDATETVTYAGEITAIDHIWDIFMKNDVAVEADVARVTSGRKSQPLSATCTVIGDPARIFIEEGAWVEGVTLNTLGGSIYIGRDATVSEGSCLRGPLVVAEHAVVNMCARISGPTTIGPWCKVGGEISNVVMIGYSNKGHDGFLGNAVIGEWCNLGAGTVASNLKNDYSEIKVWNYPARRFLRTGLQFCGLIMGDHSKSAINTSFNTATVVGVGCNVISEGMPRVFIPSFSKGGTAGFEEVNLREFFTVAKRVMARRHCELTEPYMKVFEAINAFADRFR